MSRPVPIPFLIVSTLLTLLHPPPPVVQSAMVRNVAVLILVDEADPYRSLAARVKSTIDEELRPRADLNVNATVLVRDVRGNAESVNRLHVTSTLVCQDLLNNSAVVLVHCGEDESGAAQAIFSAAGYALGFYKIPAIGVMIRDAQFSRKNLYPTFLRTTPPFSHEASVFVRLLKALNYHQVILITVADDVNGQEFVQTFDRLRLQNKIHVQKYLELEMTDPSLNETIAAGLQGTTSNTIVLCARAAKAARIFDAAAPFMQRGRVWMASGAAFQAPNTPVGVLSARLRQTVLSALRDALAVLRDGLASLDQRLNESAVLPPSQCLTRKIDHQWINEVGHALYQRLTAPVRLDNYDLGFDEKGDRTEAAYDIINQQSEGPTVVGVMHYHGNLSVDAESIVWPGSWTRKPHEITLPKHLRAVVVPDPPFVYAVPVVSGQQCKFYKDIMVDNVLVSGPWLPCSRLENDTFTSFHCCSGFAIDLLRELSVAEADRDAAFDFDLHLNDTYGGAVLAEAGGGYQLTGMVGELDLGMADIAAGALSINPERQRFVDFSEPWLYHGIRVLEKFQPRDSPMESFLQPLKNSLWSALFVSVIAIGCIIYILDFNSPFEQFYRADFFNQERDETRVTFGEAMWFVWGVLLNSGVSEKTPRSFSARTLGIVWCGFCMIMVASYTANLAAFLVLDQPDKSLNGINDPKFRNPSVNFSFGTVLHSNTYQYFKRHVEMSTIFRKMEGHNFRTAKEAIGALLNDTLGAFIWDSVRLDFEAAKNCDLRTRGSLFGRSAYGIGLRKNSPWTPFITSAILRLSERSLIEEMETKWIRSAQTKKCHHEVHKTPARLGLQNMRDLFILVAVGVVVGSTLSVIEVQWGRAQDNTDRRRRLAQAYGQKWRLRVRSRSSLTNTTAENAELVKKFPDVDPFLLQKWERIFIMFFDRNLSHNVDWGDFYLVVRRCRDVYGAESTQIGYARKSMEALWQGLCKAADTDRDKLISLEEWAALLREVARKKDDHPKWIDDYQSFMFKLFDVSADGVLDQAEYADGMSLYGFTYTEAVEAFNKFAVDTQGQPVKKVNPQQWKEMFLQLFFSTDKSLPGNHLFGKVAEI